MTYKVSDIADIINISVKNPSNSGINTFVGLEHYDVGEPVITRYGSTEMLTTAVKKFNCGDILLARRNVYLRRAGKVDFDGVTSGDSIVIRVKSDLSKLEECDSTVMQSLLPFILNTNAFWDYANTNSDGTMSKRLSPQMLLEYEFDLPSLTEQKVLADKLWAAYRLKESYKKLLAATEEMVKSQFIEMFGTPFSPKYHSMELGDICQIKSGTTFKADEEKLEGDVPYSKVADMNLQGNEIYLRKSTHYVDCNVAKDFYLPKGTVIFPKRGAAINTNKKRILQRNTCVDLNIIGVIPSEKICSIYLYWYFRCIDLSEICDNSGIPQINNKHLIPLTIGVPPLAKQNEIEQIFHQADKSEFELRKSIDAIDAVIKSLINS
jgi:type I restriction enzyme S subunit